MPPDEVLRLADLVDPRDLMEEWRRLAARVDGSSYFQTPDWVLSWWETIGGRPPTEAAIWRDARGALEGIVVLSRIDEPLHPRFPLRIPMWTNTESGYDEADHCGWPVVPERIAEVRDWLAWRTKATPLLMRNLDPQTGVPFVCPGARLLARFACPRIEVLPSVADLESAPVPGRRARKRARELEEAGVTFRWVPPERLDPAILDPLLRFHHERMQAKGRLLAVNPQEGQFHRRLITRASQGRGPAALLAELDGRPIGVEYGFLWGDVFAGYKNGWDPAWAHLRLGNVLLRETIKSLGHRGVRIFDLLRGREPYKYEFSPIERYDETWFVPNGPAGKILAMRERALRLVHRDSGFRLW
jgi:CelD/BcsL family acetyltransferase involved in cellulose biosynthesis